jgi:crotonobetaine/carnitine-CoA ligase
MSEPQAVPSHTGSETLGSLFSRSVEAAGDRPFLAFEAVDGSTRRLSYAEAGRRIDRVAGLLAKLGVERGSRIHLHLVNCPEFYEVWLAAARLGAAIVPTNPLSTVDELRYMVGHAGCGLSVTQPDLSDPVRAAVTGDATVVVAGTEQTLRGCVPYEVALNDAPPWRRGSRAAPADVAAVLYTSGTTSRPKGVLITHAAYVHAGEAVSQHLRMRPADRTLVVLPLFHGNAQYYSTLPALSTGASIALVERFSASRWSAQAHRLQATIASLFAAPIRMILAKPPAPDDRRHPLRVVMFAQNLTPGQLAEFERRFSVPLLQLYGMTETVAPVTLNPLYGERRNMTIGRPMLWSRVRIVDQHGEDVAPGETGELLVSGEPGETIFSGYFNDPEATAASLSDGWFSTGDNVRADADGYIHFVDRGKDMIKRAGENVSAGEIERTLVEHPEVFDAACIAIPDPLRDEAIKAFVVLREGAALDAATLREWCSTRLAAFKVPSEFEFVDGLPRTSVGKVQKHLLRERTVGEAGH